MDEIIKSGKPLGAAMSSPSRKTTYRATGQKLVEEAWRSAASVKKCMSDISITLFSNISFESNLFDQVVPKDNPTHGPEDKILNIAKSPYQETLHLDSDTHRVDDCLELFLQLGRFDLVAVYAPYRAQYQVNEVPDCFPELNMGSLSSENRTKRNGSLNDGPRFTYWIV